MAKHGQSADEKTIAQLVGTVLANPGAGVLRDYPKAAFLENVKARRFLREMLAPFFVENRPRGDFYTENHDSRRIVRMVLAMWRDKVGGPNRTRVTAKQVLQAVATLLSAAAQDDEDQGDLDDSESDEGGDSLTPQ